MYKGWILVQNPSPGHHFLSLLRVLSLSKQLQTVEPLQWFFSPHTHTTSFSLSGKEVLVKHMSGETKFALNFLWCSWFSSGFGLWCFQPCILMENFRYFLPIGHLLTLSSEKCQCNVLSQDFTLARVAFVWYYLRSRGLFDLKFPSHSCICKNYMILKDLRFMSRWFQQWTARQTFELYFEVVPDLFSL